MSVKVDEDSPAEFLLEMAKAQGGVACVEAKDGHVLVFNKASLENLLDQCVKGGKDRVIIFVKRSTPGATS